MSGDSVEFTFPSLPGFSFTATHFGRHDGGAIEIRVQPEDGSEFAYRWLDQAFALPKSSTTDSPESSSK